MKKLHISILKPYKLYRENTDYYLDGDLIILSGTNGSGKSQLFKIISQNTNESIVRTISQSNDGGEEVAIEEVLLLSFRDNIDLGSDFGHYSVTYKENFSTAAWNYYKNNIKFTNNQFWDSKRRVKFEKELLTDDKGIKNPSWRSISKLIQLIKKNYPDERAFNLTQTELEGILPNDFIWRNENDIIDQIGNLFYIACCKRVDEQIKCSKSAEVFDNAEWLKNAPWTILNELFEELNFKYRFKSDYQFTTPNIEENPLLREGTNIRNINDLSDGEKAILKLALNSLDEEISKDIKLVLFDEYDAPLNPSLAEAFFRVIEKFYIEKGIQVIIATHSPATISLAPTYAQFYELFSRENASPQLCQVSQFEYSELRIANKQFYDKIKNQESRIAELMMNTKSIENNCLFVEDRYNQIYKIAFLKIKGIDGITEENLDEKFQTNCPFSIHGNFSCNGLLGYLTCSNVTHDCNHIIVCLFDFDTEGYKKFEDLEKKKENSKNMFDVRKGTVKEGLYMKHHHANRFALMLPIPDRLKKYVSEKTSTDCFIEIETLLSEEYLKTNPKAEIRSDALPFYKMKDRHKCDFWRDLISIDSKYFEDFRPLFDQLEKLFGGCKD